MKISVRVEREIVRVILEQEYLFKSHQCKRPDVFFIYVSKIMSHMFSAIGHIGSFVSISVKV